jgi:hypothetical protein
MFSKTEYKGTFERHLSILQEWEKLLPGPMRSIRHDLIKNGQ